MIPSTSVSSLNQDEILTPLTLIYNKKSSTIILTENHSLNEIKQLLFYQFKLSKDVEAVGVVNENGEVTPLSLMCLCPSLIAYKGPLHLLVSKKLVNNEEDEDEIINNNNYIENIQENDEEQSNNTTNDSNNINEEINDDENNSRIFSIIKTFVNNDVDFQLNKKQLKVLNYIIDQER